MKTCQDHGMLIWHVSGTHPVTVFKQLFAAFAGNILETCSLKIPANCQWRCYRCADESHTLRKNPSQGILTCWRVITVVPMFVKVLILVIFEDKLKSFELIWEVNMNSEEIHTEGLPLFCVVFTWDAVAVMCKILQNKRMSYLSVSRFLFPSLSRTHLCVSIVSVSFWEEVIFTRHLSQVASVAYIQRHKHSNHYV